MANFDFLEGAILTDEEMVVVHGGISVAMTGGSHCGSGCDGGGGSHCGKDCRPAHLESSHKCNGRTLSSETSNKYK